MLAGKAVALAESMEFGKDYAKQVIQNAKSLAHSCSLRLRRFGGKRGYTESHQIAVDVSKFGDGVY
jgi:glycine hydroxymethyltransferase